MNSQPHSHTHYQAAQANAQTKAWQRVCLSHPGKIELKESSLPSENKKYATAQTNTKNTDKRSIDNGLQGWATRTTGYNKVLPKWRQKCYYEAFVQSSTFVLRMNSSVKNPPQRKAANRQTV